MILTILFYILCFIIGIFAYYYYFYYKINKKNAIVCLTKGYDNNESYDNLIKRNQSIYEKYYRKIVNKGEYDIVIFHEGNISLQQQNYIQENTPLMPIVFVSIPFYSDVGLNMDLCPPTKLSSGFSIGYKNMCYFWSIDFLHYLSDYEYIVRIDEDCIIDDIPLNILEEYRENSIAFSSGHYQNNDFADVTVGMRRLFSKLIGTDNFDSEIRCPYTNFMIVNVPFFNTNESISNALKKIEESRCIFSNRWGDLPIWGYILTLFVDEKHYIEDKRIRYFHGSHNSKINM
jgi:hypothetical protein